MCSWPKIYSNKINAALIDFLDPISHYVLEATNYLALSSEQRSLEYLTPCL